MDESCGNSFLQRTAAMWQSSVWSFLDTANLSVFPYLDMEMYWTAGGQLCFLVHLKPNQQLLYT
jgi:hypothetical protein